MTTAKERFAIMLDRDLDSANAESGAFGNFYIEAKKKYVQEQGELLKKSGGASTSETDREFAAQFDSQVWNKEKDGLKEQLKLKTLAAYEGKSNEETAQELTSGVMDRASTAIGGGFSSLLTGGDFGAGLSHHMRHGLITTLMGIPFVGKGIAILTTYIGSKLNSLFGGEQSLSWKETLEKVERENIKKRMNERLGNMANVDRLADMVNKSAQPFTPEEEQLYSARPQAAASAIVQETAPLPVSVLPVPQTEPVPAVAAQEPSVQNMELLVPVERGPNLDLPAPARKLQELAKGEVIPGASGGDSATVDDHAAAPPPTTQTTVVQPEQPAAGVSPQ